VYLLHTVVICNFSLIGSGDLWYSLKPKYVQRIFSIFNSAYLFVVVRALLAGAAANHATPIRADCPATGNPMMGKLPTVMTIRTAMVRTKNIDHHIPVTAVAFLPFSFWWALLMSMLAVGFVYRALDVQKFRRGAELSGLNF
jgi:hypothetical protein